MSGGQAPQPLHLLHPGGAVALIVGIVIGAGIFKTPSLVAGASGDAGWALALWVAGALVSLAGALCYAELCTAYPHAGGDYHFLRRAFGRDLSFLYAWARVTLINPGSIALLAFVFGDYISTLAPLGAHSSAIWALLVVLGLTVVNLIGIHASSRMQTLLLVLELAGLGAIVVAGLSVPAPVSGPLTWFEGPAGAVPWGLCLVFVLLTFSGWNEAAYVSAEIRGGPRVMVGVIVASMAALVAIYLLVNVALLQGLGLRGLSDSKTAAADLLGLAFGPRAQQALGLLVAIAALTSINATMIVGARTGFALGRDWRTLRALGQWQRQAGAPRRALWVQAALSAGLVMLAMREADGFSALVEFTSPVFWGFLFAVGLALLALRRRDGGAPRPFRVPLYPLVPLVFCATCAWLAWASIDYAISQGTLYVSGLLVASGAGALALLRWREGRYRWFLGAGRKAG